MTGLKRNVCATLGGSVDGCVYSSEEVGLYNIPFSFSILIRSVGMIPSFDVRKAILSKMPSHALVQPSISRSLHFELSDAMG